MAGRGVYEQTRGEYGQHNDPIDPEAVREQVQRIVADPLFGNSKRYSDLLTFITERSLDGQIDDLKERIVGIKVFGRCADYDTSRDTTVRVAANQVRKRLALYYREPGREQELRIDVRSGSYLAEFRLAQQTLSEPQAAQDERPEPESQRPGYIKSAIGALGRRRLGYLGTAGAIVVVILAAWGLRPVLNPRPAIDQFWSPLLNSSGLVVIYPPFPSSAPAPAGSLFYDFLKSRGQVPVNDVSATSALSFFLRQKGKESMVHAAPGVTLATLRSTPAILLGSFSNDWVIKLGANLRFQFRRKSELGLRWIEDSVDSQNRSWAVDLSVPYEQVNDDYALISRVFDQTTGQWLIAIGGLSGFATSSACELVTDPNAMASLSALLPKDWPSKNLQVVLAVKLIEGSPGASRIVATYSW